MAYRNFLVERDGAIARFTLNRPEKLNAINRETLREIAHLSLELSEDAQTHVIIVTGAGRAFSAGADVSEFPTTPSPDVIDESRVRSRLGHRTLRGFIDLEQITIAAVNGWAAGAGLSIAMACDIRIAADNARFTIPEVDLGIPYLWTSTVLLSRLVGPAKAKELIMTCDRIDAEQALQMGLVNQVVPADELMPTVEALAQKLAAKPYAALRATKIMVNSINAPFGEIAHYDAEIASFCRALGDYGTGQAAFKAKKG